jgi:hypothetical protein
MMTVPPLGALAELSREVSELQGPLKEYAAGALSLEQALSAAVYALGKALVASRHQTEHHKRLCMEAGTAAQAARDALRAAEQAGAQMRSDLEAAREIGAARARELLSVVTLLDADVLRRNTALVSANREQARTIAELERRVTEADAYADYLYGALERIGKLTTAALLSEDAEE